MVVTFGPCVEISETPGFIRICSPYAAVPGSTRTTSPLAALQMATWMVQHFGWPLLPQLEAVLHPVVLSTKTSTASNSSPSTMAGQYSRR